MTHSQSQQLQQTQKHVSSPLISPSSPAPPNTGNIRVDFEGHETGNCDISTPPSSLRLGPQRASQRQLQQAYWCVCVCVCASLFSCMCSLTFSAFVCTRTRKRAFAHKHGQTHKEVAEVTIPTMAWRMRPDAGYAVAQVCDNTNRHTNRHTDTQTPDTQVCVSLPSARFPVGVFLLPVTVLGCVLLLV